MSDLQRQALEVALDANAPVILWGEPGVGKTATVQAIVRERGGYMYTFIASQRDPVDLTGAMHPATRAVRGDGEVTVTAYAVPEWAVALNEHAVDGDFTVLFLDEFSTAPPIMQAACLRLLHERMVGDYRLHESIRIVLAANPADVAAYGHDLAPPAANRIVHLQWSLTAEEWSEGILYRGWIPELVDPAAERALRADVLPSLTAYVLRSGHLHVRPEGDSDAGRAWPSGRTWAQGAVLLAYARARGADEDVQGTLLAGAVGMAHAAEYLAYARDLDLPDPEAILTDPGSWTRPERQDQVFAALGALVSAACRELTRERRLAAAQVLAAVARGTDGGEPRPDLALPHFRQLELAVVESGKRLGDVAEYLEPFRDALVASGILRNG